MEKILLRAAGSGGKAFAKFKYRGKLRTVRFVKGAGWTLRVLAAASLYKAYSTYGAEGVVSDYLFGDASLLPSSHNGPPGSVFILNENGNLDLVPIETLFRTVSPEDKDVDIFAPGEEDKVVDPTTKYAE